MGPTRMRAWRAGPAAVMLLALAMAPAGAAPVPAGPSLTPVTRTLENGLKVAVFSSPRLPIVQIGLLVPAGAAAESSAQAGVAYVTAELLRQGTELRDPLAYARELDKLGGDIGSSVTRDYASLTGAFLARDIEAGMELMSDAVIHPALGEKELERVKSRALRTIAQLRQNPASLAEEYTWRSAFARRPYGQPLFGTTESVMALRVEHVRAFYHAHYAPNGAVLAIAGDVTPARAFAVAQQWFGQWSGQVELVPVAPTPPRPLRSTIRLVDRPGVTETALAVGFVAPPRNSADNVPIVIANRTLGASPISRLARLAQRSGRLRSDYVALKDGGLLMIGISVRNDSVASVARRLRAELARFANEPPPERELAPIRRMARQAFPVPFEALGALLAEWTAAEFYRLPADYLSSYSAAVDSVSPARLAAAVRRWLDPGRLTWVAVGPAAAIKRQLESLGPVEVIKTEAGVTAGTTAGGSPTRAQQSRGRELVRLAIAAHGGLARLRGIKDSTMEADATLSIGGRSVQGKIRQVRKDPYKMLYTTGFGGIETHQVLNGNQAWSIAISDTQAVQEMDSLGVKAMRSGFTTDLPHLLLLAADPGARVANQAQTQVDGHAADPVAIVSRSGERRVLYFDAVNHRLIAMDLSEPGSPGEGYAARRVYRDHRPVGGILWPHYEERRLNQRPLMRIKVTRLILNSGIEDAEFEPPGPELPPPAR